MIQHQYVKRTARIPSLCRSHWVDRMEIDIREMAFAGENVTPETLKQRGYSDAVISRYGQAAVDMARRRSIRRIDHVEA